MLRTPPDNPPGFRPPQALRDLTEAGVLGHPGALYEHGVMYEEGKAIAQDYRAAFDHYMKCACIPEDPDEAGHLEVCVKFKILLALLLLLVPGMPRYQSW